MARNNSVTCRVCLGTNIRHYKLIHEKYKSGIVSEYITSIATVIIKQGDGLPDKICSACLKKLDIAVEFKKLCENSDMILSSNLKNVEIKLKQEKHKDVSKELEYNLELKSEEEEINDSFEEEKLKLESQEDRSVTFYDQCDNEYSISNYDPEKHVDVTKKFENNLELKSEKVQRNDSSEGKKLKSESQEDGSKPFNDQYHYVTVDNYDLVINLNQDKMLKECAGKVNKLNKVELGLRPSRAINLNLECHDCGQFFKSKCKMRVHWKTVHLPQALLCPTCKRAFKSFKAFNLHKNKANTSCNVASKVNVVGQGKSREYHCKGCDYKTKKILLMKSHLVTHTGERPFLCNICGSNHTQRSSLDRHKESVHKIYTLEVACHICGKMLKGREQFYRHKSQHREPQGIVCKVCGKFLKSKKYLYFHMQRHSAVKKYNCNDCERTFYTSSDLYNHRFVHDKEKRKSYSCDLCEYKNHNRIRMKNHIMQHSGNNYPCQFCGMFLESEQKYVMHLRCHSSNKKYKCPHCETRFVRKDGIQKHIKNKHSSLYVPQKKPSRKIKDEYSIVKPEDKVEIELSPIVTKDDK